MYKKLLIVALVLIIAGGFSLMYFKSHTAGQMPAVQTAPVKTAEKEGSRIVYKTYTQNDSRIYQIYPDGSGKKEYSDIADAMYPDQARNRVLYSFETGSGYKHDLHTSIYVKDRSGKKYSIAELDNKNVSNINFSPD